MNCFAMTKQEVWWENNKILIKISSIHIFSVDYGRDMTRRQLCSMKHTQTSMNWKDQSVRFVLTRNDEIQWLNETNPLNWIILNKPDK